MTRATQCALLAGKLGWSVNFDTHAHRYIAQPPNHSDNGVSIVAPTPEQLERRVRALESQTMSFPKQEATSWRHTG